jgi:hypothetical protein
MFSRFWFPLRKYRRHVKEDYHAEKAGNKNKRNDLSPFIREAVVERAITTHQTNWI